MRGEGVIRTARLRRDSGHRLAHAVIVRQFYGMC